MFKKYKILKLDEQFSIKKDITYFFTKNELQKGNK